jgi:glycosyltransferase involved in cell wall biosynthesis
VNPRAHDEEAGALTSSKASGDTAPAVDELDVSIVMPCLNEEQSVPACVKTALAWLDRSALKGEVIVVDNGSTDGSAEAAAAAGATVIRYDVRGYGRALLRGFREARGKYVVMGDCDGTYEFGELEPLIAPLRDGYEMVVGDRLGSMLAPGAMPWAHRFLGTPMISAVLRLFTGAKVRDSQCGLRAIQREALERLDLKATGMEFASEMILKATRQGLRVTEVDVPYYVRIGESKLNTFSDGWRHLKYLLISSPSYVFIGPGLVFLLLGLLSLAVTVFTTNGVTIGSVNWHPIFAAGIFLVVGINTMMLGVCSKLLAFRQGLQEEDRVVRFYRRYLGLEKMILVAAVLGLIGLILDGWVLIVWAGDSERGLLPTATVAQALLVIAANLIFSSLAAAMIDYEDYYS